MDNEPGMTCMCGARHVIQPENLLTSEVIFGLMQERRREINNNIRESFQTLEARNLELKNRIQLLTGEKVEDIQRQCEYAKNRVDLKVEQLKVSIDDYRETLLASIDAYETDRVEMFTNRERLIVRVAGITIQVNEFIDKVFVSRFSFEESKAIKYQGKVDSWLKKLKKGENELKSVLHDRKGIEFVTPEPPNAVLLTSEIVGELKYEQYFKNFRQMSVARLCPNHSREFAVISVQIETRTFFFSFINQESSLVISKANFDGQLLHSITAPIKQLNVQKYHLREFRDSIALHVSISTGSHARREAYSTWNGINFLEVFKRLMKREFSH
jgi:hypothetical protein